MNRAHAYEILFRGRPAANHDAVNTISAARTNLTLRDWERTAIDASGGKIMLDEEVERHVEFDEEHVDRFKGVMGER